MALHCRCCCRWRSICGGIVTSCLPQHDCSDCRAAVISIVPPLQVAETRNSLVGYRHPVSRARDSTKILRLRLIHHRQKIPICRTAGGGDASPLPPPWIRHWSYDWICHLNSRPNSSDWISQLNCRPTFNDRIIVKLIRNSIGQDSSRPTSYDWIGQLSSCRTSGGWISQES